MREFLYFASLFLCWISLVTSIQNSGSDGNWFGHGCPPRATGQFPYAGDCKRFYNCFKGRGQLSVCAPGTLFNPDTLECDFPAKVACMKGSERGPETSRITDDSPQHQHPHHHHHSHNFQHSPEYHSRDHSPHYHSQAYNPRSQDQRAHQHPSWQSANPQIPPRGHYIFEEPPSVKASGPSRNLHSGVQPPGVLPSQPARELLPPPSDGEPEPARPIPRPIPSRPAKGYPQPSPGQSVYAPEEQSLYNPNYGRPTPQGQPNFAKKFDSVNPRPALSFNPYGPPPRQDAGKELPDSEEGESDYSPPPGYTPHGYGQLPPLPSPGGYYSPPSSQQPKPQYPSTDYFPRPEQPHYQQGYTPQQPPSQGYNPQQQPTSLGYNPQQPTSQGYNPQQRPSQGYNPQQPPSLGYNPQQPPSLGYNPQQRPSQGYSPQQTPSTGYGSQQTPSVVTAVPPPDYEGPDLSYGGRPGYSPLGGNRLDEPVRPTTSTEPPQKSYNRDACPRSFSGLMPHSDCTKFMSCSHGRTFVMSCGPGTRFDPELLVCDHAHLVKCFSGDLNTDDVDVIDPQESQQSPQFFDIPGRRDGNHSGKPGGKAASSPPTTTTTTPSYTTEEAQSELPDYLEPPYETFKSRPALSISLSEPSEQPQTKHSVKNVFRPANITLPKGRLISKRNSTSERQILRLRGSPAQFEGFVEMQLAPGSWGMLCDKSNKWKSEEAHVVCRTLGFPRGAELTWQGLPAEVSNVTSDLLAADEVVCSGSEESILDCTFNVGSGCNPGKDGIWVRCYGHGQSRCGPGELSLAENCYSLVVPDEDAPTEHLVGFTQGEALKYCQTKGGRLLDVTSQLENDFVSEWLVRQDVVGNIMTSGVGTLLMGVPVWIWEGSDATLSYHNWWPGWEGVRSLPPQLTSGGAHCIVLRRHFPCLGHNGSEEKLCDTQYYFWDVEDCSAMSTSQPYVCERPANNIGCVTGTGASYKGAANITKSGKHCLNWENKQVLAELKYKISESDRKMSLSGHNYCRNVAGSEKHPWCFVESGKSVKKDLCDIPFCSKAIEKSARFFQCPPNHYSCGANGECIPSSKVCDGRYDCSNANDEVGCGKPQNLLEASGVAILSQFDVTVNMKLSVMEIEIIVDSPLAKCAEKCLERVNCRSFSYLEVEKECLLSEGNIGLTGALVSSPDWNYYELLSKSMNCQMSHTCKNGKCIANETVCNGRNDCGDNSDESDCSWLKQKIQIRLTGGSKSSEGAIEVKTHDRWGLICDDEFDLRDANVICKHLGYPLGALEVKKHGHFKPNQTSSFIIDNLNCTGDETSLADCHHNGWGIHDCGNEESVNSIDYVKCSNKAAGVICKEMKSECNFNYWQCATSAECIPLAFLCDNVRDCADSSDEDPAKCEAGVEVRLVGIGGVSRSNKVTEGRVEVKRFGVWGTICDDDFTEREAAVVCKSLGYDGPAQAYKEAAFGAGKGIIWLDQVHCQGNETDITDCMADPWGQTNCKHNEDVAVACASQGFNIPPKAIAKGQIELPDQEIDDSYLDDIFTDDCGTVMGNLDIAASEFAPRVVSGFETVKGTYPWQASIRVKSVSGKSSHWCGAVIVSRVHVITAGHCLRDYIKAAYFVRVGDFDNEVNEGTERDYEIDEIWIHPDLDKNVRLNNDIAVVKIKGSGMEFDSWVRPACLPSKREIQLPKNCTISGWGSNASPGTGFARTLHATWLSPLPTAKCRTPFVYGDSMSDGMFCAGSLEGGPDSCQGDSGGPFLCPQRGKMTLFGITSWGHGCGRPNSPGVYTNIPFYLDWINEKIMVSMKSQRTNNKRML